MSHAADIRDNVGWASACPMLSVLIPFLRDNPGPLLALLEREADALAGRVELVILDDGTGDATLTRALLDQAGSMVLPVRLVTLTANEGRSIGRNRLAAASRGATLLFLDSDMRPDGSAFLQTWMDLVEREHPAVAFGGFSLLQAPADARFSVHRALAAKSECVPQPERAKQPAKYVYTSNLLVRRDVFEAEAFDPGFTGWGWEDVEWAMRVSRRFDVIHIDNPATHMGLDTVDALAGKYEQAAPNFARMVAKHPQTVAAYPSYRAARLIRRIPGAIRARHLLRTAAETEWLPTATRAFSLRLYRAALYADAV